MKKLAISIMTLGIVGFGFAQYEQPKFELSEFRSLGARDSDKEYLSGVQNRLTPKQVKYLENIVSYWDVTKSEKFDGRQGEPFEVTFTLKDGQITAYYDNEGKVISAMERFQNFAMPRAVGNQIVRQHPNWKIVKNRYTVWYSRKHRTKRIFKVQVQKGNRKKWLTIDLSGHVS